MYRNLTNAERLDRIDARVQVTHWMMIVVTGISIGFSVGHIRVARLLVTMSGQVDRLVERDSCAGGDTSAARDALHASGASADVPGPAR